MNIDLNETAKFNQMASRWWDPDGECQALHDLNPVRLNFVTDCIDLQQKKVLDIGCGGGIFSESMTKAGAKVTALDAAEQSIHVAKLHALDAQLDIDYQHGVIEHLIEKKIECFDVITCLELLEHVPDPTKLVKDCAAMLRPGGHCFFSTLNRTPKAFLLSIVGAEYCFNILPKGTHQYAKFIKPAELANCLRNAGLNLFKLSGLAYNPFARTAKLTEDVSVNYIVYAKKGN